MNLSRIDHDLLQKTGSRVFEAQSEECFSSCACKPVTPAQMLERESIQLALRYLPKSPNHL